MKVTNLLVIIFSIEKILQHLLTAIFFIFTIPGIGTPDIGSHIQINNNSMAFLNLFFAALFTYGLAVKIRGPKWGTIPLIILASADILLEFIFHGFFFITVSVLVSALLLTISIKQMRKERIYSTGQGIN